METGNWEEEALQIDREDLFSIIEMRFGQVPSVVRRVVLQIKKPDVMQRLILAAANVPDWAAFLKELQAGEKAFRLVGEDFNPLAKETGRRTS